MRLVPAALTLALISSSVCASSWTQVQKLAASDGAADDSLGIQAAISGDRLMMASIFADVAGHNSQGAAYIWVRSGATWVQEAKLFANDGAANDQFSTDVALDGDTAVCGSPLSDAAGADSGAVYVYVRSGSTWTLQQKIVPADAQAGDDFGVSLALQGDTLVIGADTDDEAGMNSGSAYVFRRTGTTWNQVAKLIPNDGQNGDSAGRDVAIDGNTVLVSAHADDDGGSNSGSFYAFVENGGTWTQQWKFHAPDPAPMDNFGRSVAIVGDTAVASAFLHDDVQTDAGAVYVFVRNGTTWALQQEIVPFDAAPGENFGKACTLAQDRLVVGGVRDDDLGFDSGSVYIYARNGATWTFAQKLLAADGGPDDIFGSSVAVEGAVLFVGAAKDDAPANASGSGYVFELTDPGTVFCAGDGSASACPCGNAGASGHGCASSVASSGAVLIASGAASLAYDTLVLSGASMPNASALYFQGTSQVAGGTGVAFGDGLRCAGGTVVRLATKANVLGASQYPDVGDALLSVGGNVTSPGARYYQVWYRNAASFCTSDTWNLTNGLSVTWTY